MQKIDKASQQVDEALSIVTDLVTKVIRSPDTQEPELDNALLQLKNLISLRESVKDASNGIYEMAAEITSAELNNTLIDPSELAEFANWAAGQADEILAATTKNLDTMRKAHLS